MPTDGVLLVDKPEGITSAGVVRALKRRVAPRKIGHLGTLDPFATGLLPICIGEATKLAPFLSSEDKAYAGRIRLGIETDSLDCTGQVLVEAEAPILAPGDLERLGAEFSGRRWQRPPMFSAVKQGGVPLYRLARQGIEVERAPRPIEVHTLRLTAAAPAEIDFYLECSKGTYVRVLAAEIGRALGCGGHLLSLRRLRFGTFDIRDAYPLAVLEQWPARGLPVLRIDAALGHLRALRIQPEAARLLRHGQQGVLARLPGPETAGEAAKVVTTTDEVVAIVEAAGTGTRWRLVRTLAPSQENRDTQTPKLYKPQTVC